MILEILDQAIQPGYRIRAKNGSVTITESNAGAANGGLSIKASVKQVALSLDGKPRRKGEGDPAFPVLNPSCAGFCSRCDGIIFCHEHEDHVLVFLVELKSGSTSGALDQLKSGRAFAQWLLELARVHRGFAGKVSFYGLVVTARRAPLRGTTRPAQIKFADRNGLRAAEWDHSMPLTLTALVNAAKTA
jgi:hypothetical protein